MEIISIDTYDGNVTNWTSMDMIPICLTLDQALLLKSLTSLTRQNSPKKINKIVRLGDANFFDSFFPPSWVNNVTHKLISCGIRSKWHLSKTIWDGTLNNISLLGKVNPDITISGIQTVLDWIFTGFSSGPALNWRNRMPRGMRF